MKNSTTIRPAILMCTCTPYVGVARATHQLLDVFWEKHPDFFIVGDAGADDQDKIPFSCSEKDWIGMALESVTWLINKGYTHCYLILDDHPPIGVCNSSFLNNTLPSICEQLKATHIALAGWDQFQPKEGGIINVEGQQWMLNSVSYKWKFDLHPGYWNLQDLALILDKVMAVSPRVYSARSFEGISSTLDLSPRLVNSTFKIGGNRIVVGNKWYQNRLTRGGGLYCLHAVRLAVRAGGRECLDRLDRKIEIYTQYINGPYPMYWSGVIKKGELNTNLVKFADITRNNIVKQWLGSFSPPA